MKTSVILCDRCGVICDRNNSARYLISTLNVGKGVSTPRSFDICFEHCLQDLRQYLEYAYPQAT